MSEFFKKRWFLILLTLSVATGFSCGGQLPASAIKTINGVVRPQYITMLVLFLMSFSLNSRQLKNALSHPTPAIWATLINLGLIPLCALGLMRLQISLDFQIGLMIAASVPCTLATASVWTRKAHGNDAVSLLVTVVTNSSCFLVTPLWLGLATRSGASLDVTSMMERLIYSVIIPTAAGQAIRVVPALAKLADRHKKVFSTCAQVLILSMVLLSSINAGTQLTVDVLDDKALAFAVVWGSCLLLHVSAMLLAHGGNRVAGFDRADGIAVLFASSQKTLPIGVLLATDATMYGNPNFVSEGVGIPFAVFPIILYHISQLFFDTLVADRLAQNGALVEREKTAPEKKNQP